MDAVMNKSPLILIDGSSYLFRAYHALPQLTNADGHPTGAMYGVLNMIKRLLNDYKPEHIAVVFDTKAPTFRHQMYPDYKANRPPMAEELAVQIQPLFDIIRAMGIPLIMQDGVEADDIIGTLAKQAAEDNFDVIISTGDKDMAQLVNDRVTLVNTMTNTTMDTDGVLNKFGVPPALIVDYLTLIGDTVDNVPGVPKVGPKTAVKWLNEFGSLDNIKENADAITGKVGENLRSTLPDLPLCKSLVTIKHDVDLDFKPNELKPKQPDQAELIRLCQLYEFKSWLAKLLDQQADEDKEQAKPFATIFDKKTFKQWLDWLNQCSLFAFDTETTSLATHSAKLVGISIALDKRGAAYIPLAHDYPGAPKQLDRDWVLSELKPLLENPSIIKVGQNLKYDMGVLDNYNIQLQGIGYDTMLESYVLDSAASRHDMDTLALKYLGKKTISFEDIAGKGAKQLTFNEIELEQAAIYAAEDASVTLDLHKSIWPRLENIKPLKTVFTDIEMPLVSVLSRIERHGVLIDSKVLKKQSATLAKRINELQETAYTIAGGTFNLSSPKQLQTILYDQLNLPVLQKTPKGQPSTAENVLQELSHEFELPQVILEYRSLSKLKSTYTDKLPQQINPTTKRIHTSYHQAVTATGRLSSSDPNLQNIPVRTEQGRLIRKAFIAPKGYKIIAADYSQIELRIMAHLSQDKGLLEAFAKNLDIHKATAAEVFGVALEGVTSDQRRHAKAINFGLMYGMSSFGLAKQLEVDKKTAQAYIDEYFRRYPGIHRYMESTRDLAHEQGYVETLFGRRLYLPEINAANMNRQKAAERAAVNAPLQGTAADIIKRAMINIDAWLRSSNSNAHMVMQVHDELVFEAPENEVETLTQSIDEYMCQAAELDVDLTVAVGVGNNWDEAH